MRANDLNPGLASRAIILIRLMVGGVFLVEGILKFLRPEELAAGRFEKIGLPSPHLLGPCVGGIEVICGAMVLVGLLTRWATIPLLGVISVAILSTKIPILLGTGFWGFKLAKLAHYGLLDMVHEARTDLSMLLGLVFLLLVGGGCWSLEAKLGAGGGQASSGAGSSADKRH
jgi:putative oxidoreductase